MAKKKKAPTSLEDIVEDINNRYGDGALMMMSDSQNMQIDGIPTGSLDLDLALGGKGIPKGRVIEFYGPESSGKSTLALHIVANLQKEGGRAAYIDAEHALDIDWAKKIGVQVDDLLISQPDSGEQALDITESLVKSGRIGLIIVDSVAALVPSAELQGDMGQSHVGLQARLMSQALRKLSGVVSKSHTCIIFINQIRMKIGVMFGNPETTSGGNALKFYSSVRLDIRRVSTLKDKDGNPVGNHVRVRVVKNKVAPPFKTAEFDILFNQGIDSMGDLLDIAVRLGVVNREGSWYSYGDQKLGQGRDNAIEYLTNICFEDVLTDVKELI